MRGPDHRDEVGRYLRQSLELATDLGMRPELAHAHLGLARLLRNASSHEQAREHLTTAATMCRELDYATVVRELRERTADVQAVLTRQTPQARQMLRKLLAGKIAVEPIAIDSRRGFRLSGRLNVGRLLRADVVRAVEAAATAVTITV